MCKELKITHDDSYMVYKMDLNNMTSEDKDELNWWKKWYYRK